MNKTCGAALLVAGTCIGSGIIALPMVLAKIGVIPSVLFMLFIWFIMYFTSLISLELNLQAGHGLSLGALGRLFSGRTAEFIGIVSIKLLSYSLLAVFIYGGSSIFQELIASKLGIELSFRTIASWYSLAALAVCLLPIKGIDYFNRLLFIGLICVFSVLIIGLAGMVDWTNLPLISSEATDWTAWASLIPIVFTSFGFQVIFHTLTNYCQKNVSELKRAFFWGTLIPAIVYIIWTCSVLSVVHHDDPGFYAKMQAGEVEVGQLVERLGSLAKGPSVQLLVWWISSLAIATSVIGVGVGLCDSLNVMMSSQVPNGSVRKLLAALATVLPAYLLVVTIPNAFLALLSFAGMILAVIAILLPVYLFRQTEGKHLHYTELKATPLVLLSVVVGVLVILAELFNICSSSL